MKLNKRARERCEFCRFVAIKRSLHCNLVGHGPLLDQNIKVSRQSRTSRSADQQIYDGGVARIRYADQIIPGNQPSNKQSFKFIRGAEVSSKGGYRRAMLPAELV